MATYPTLASGETVHLPYERIREFRNVHNDMEHGQRYSFNLRSTPLMRWRIQYVVSDADLATLETFWNDRAGAYESFEFTDPENATYYPTVRFDQETLEIDHAGPNENRVTVALREVI